MLPALRVRSGTLKTISLYFCPLGQGLILLKILYLFLLFGTRPDTSFVGIFGINHNLSDQSFILVDSNCWISLMESSATELLPYRQILKPWVWENVYCLLVPSVCCGSLCLVFEHYHHKLLWGFLNFVMYKRGQCYLCLMNKTCFFITFFRN